MAYICKRCNKHCKNAEGLAMHMKTHARKEPESPSLMRFLKRAPVPKKAHVELKPISKSRQLTFSVSNNASLDLHPRKASATADPPLLRVSAGPSAPSAPNPVSPPRPPRRPRNYRKKFQDMSPFAAPPELIASDLNKKSPEFRLAHMRHFQKLKEQFPMLDKKMYYDANVEHLGVKLRCFQAWFSDYQSDSVKVESNRKPKVKPERKQNKVGFFRTCSSRFRFRFGMRAGGL